jgi:nitrogen-specific signal transduction histidine kinase
MGAQVIVIEDLTDMKALEARLATTNGSRPLAAWLPCVAHEIGNPVTGIACLAQDLASESESVSVRDYTRQILDQTRRIDRIVQSLVSFSHSGKQRVQGDDPVELHDTINEAIALLRLDRESRDVNYVNECDASLRIAGDSQRLLQVFINLLNNARDASEPGDTIRIYTPRPRRQRRHRVRGRQRHRHSGGIAGQGVRALCDHQGPRQGHRAGPVAGVQHH